MLLVASIVAGCASDGGRGAEDGSPISDGAERLPCGSIDWEQSFDALARAVLILTR
jgi:hypothetical protein